MLRILLAASILCLAPCTAQAQSEPPPIEAYGGLPYVSDAELSPDGSKVAAIFNADGLTVMQVLTLQGGVLFAGRVGEFKPRYLTFHDNDHVLLRASEATRVLGYRGAFEYSASLALNIGTGEFAQIPDRVGDLYPAQSGLGRVVGAADRGGWVLTPAYLENSGARPSYDLLRVELKSGRGKRIARGTTDTIDWFVGASGNVLARERYSNEKDQYTIQAQTGRGGWRTVYEEEDNILPMRIQGVMPDESGLVFVSIDREGGFHSLTKLGFDGEESGPILGRDDREIDRVLTDRNRAVVGVLYGGLEPTYDFIDKRLQDADAAIRGQLPDATIYMDSWADDRSVILYRVFDPAIGDVWVTQRPETGELAIIAKARPHISPEHLGGLYAIRYPAGDGLSIPAIVTAPAGTSFEDVEQAPAIILPHGGPAQYDRFDFHWLAQFFASRGYLVFQPNFRGSTGFGQDFEDAGLGEWGDKMLSDIDDGVSALVRDNKIDPARVCIVGGSYGGYAALASATFYPERYQCAVAIAPVTDLKKMMVKEKRDNRGNHWVIDYWEDLMTSDGFTDAKLDAISPAQHADQIRAPILLIHGENDFVVSIEQSRIMERALERADKPAELVTLDGEDHYLSAAETRTQSLQAIDAFLKRHMPSTAPPPVPVATD